MKWPGPWIFPNTQLIANFTDLLSTWEARSNEIIWLGLEQ